MSVYKDIEPLPVCSNEQISIESLFYGIGIVIKQPIVCIVFRCNFEIEDLEIGDVNIVGDGALVGRQDEWPAYSNNVETV